jgi:AraC-like DNA-binding protein
MTSPKPQSYRDKVASTVRELHGLGWNDRMISVEIGLSTWTILQYRKELGLRATRLITPGVVRRDNKIHPHRNRIVELYHDGYSDGYIARQLGLSRRELCYYRRKHLQLPTRPRKEQADRDSGRRAQEQSMGCSLGEHRAVVYWSVATGLGWPCGMRYRAVQILELLLLNPDGLTLSQIRDQLGLTDGQLKSNDPQGMYTANLIARGLVASVARCIPTGRLVARKGSSGLVASGQNVHLYFATPAAARIKSHWRKSHSQAEEQRLLQDLASLGRKTRKVKS